MFLMPLVWGSTTSVSSGIGCRSQTCPSLPPVGRNLGAGASPPKTNTPLSVPQPSPTAAAGPVAALVPAPDRRIAIYASYFGSGSGLVDPQPAANKARPATRIVD